MEKSLNSISFKRENASPLNKRHLTTALNKSYNACKLVVNWSMQVLSLLLAWHGYDVLRLTEATFNVETLLKMLNIAHWAIGVIMEIDHTFILMFPRSVKKIDQYNGRTSANRSRLESIYFHSTDPLTYKNRADFSRKN